MSSLKSLKLAGFIRSSQHHGKYNPLVVPKRNKMPYAANEGVPPEFTNALVQDYDLSQKGIMAYLNKTRRMALKEDHKFISKRHQVLGADLAAAHFMVKRGAKVKFVGRNTWFKKDEKGNVYLPNTYVPGLQLEAIDATRMQMSHIAFDNMINLEQLRYLNFSRSIDFDDWCLARMYQFKDTLEFLDISDCVGVTENGLAILHSLKKLKGLKLTGLPYVRDMGLMVLLLEEALPECTIFGVEPESLQLPNDTDSSQLTGRVEALAGGQSTELDEPKLSDSEDTAACNRAKS